MREAYQLSTVNGQNHVSGLVDSQLLISPNNKIAQEKLDPIHLKEPLTAVNNPAFDLILAYKEPFSTRWD